MEIIFGNKTFWESQHAKCETDKISIMERDLWCNINDLNNTPRNSLAFSFEKLSKPNRQGPIQVTSSSSDSSSCSMVAAFASGMTGAGWGALNFSAAYRKINHFVFQTNGSLKNLSHM